MPASRATCPDCGWKPVSIKAHRGQALCFVRKMKQLQEARDWKRCGDFSRTFRKIGVPVESFPISVRSANAPPDGNALHYGPWSPGWACRIAVWATMYVKISMPTQSDRAEFRRGLTRSLLELALEDEAFRLAMDSVLRMNGPVPREWLEKKGIYL